MYRLRKSKTELQEQLLETQQRETSLQQKMETVRAHAAEQSLKARRENDALRLELETLQRVVHTDHDSPTSDVPTAHRQELERVKSAKASRDVDFTVVLNRKLQDLLRLLQEDEGLFVL